MKRLKYISLLLILIVGHVIDCEAFKMVSAIESVHSKETNLKKTGKLGKIDWATIKGKGFDDVTARRFGEDIAANDELAEAIADNADLADGWKQLDNMGVDDAYKTDVETIREMTEDITDEPGLEKWLDENPDKFDEWQGWENTYNSVSDPAKDAFGSGRISHKQEWDNLISDLESQGVEVVYREGGIAYSPGLKKGEAGQIIIDPDASMSALKHEHKHFLDDKAAGYKGFEGVFDPDFRINTEFNAYKTEIDFLRAEGASEDVINRLKSNFEVEVNRIKGDIGDPVDPVVINMIEQMKTL